MLMIRYFPKDIYSKAVLQKAMEAYMSFGSWKLSEDERNYIITLSQSIYDPQLTLEEFENYCIGLENQRSFSHV